MNILLVNGSPKTSGAASAALLEKVRKSLGDSHTYTLAHARLEGRARREQLEADAIVIAFPLYVDSLPAPLLEWLLSFRALGSRRPETAIYAIANCGFYEGVQNHGALRIIRNFSEALGFSWRGGIGLGTGGMFPAMKAIPDKAWIVKPVIKALDALSSDIRSWDGRGGSLPLEGSVRYVQYAFPRFLYKLAGNAGWRSEARKNGLTARELSARPPL